MLCSRSRPARAIPESAVLAATARPALRDVSLLLKWRHQFQFAGYYVAQEKGFYRDAGLRVTIGEETQQSEIARLVLNGSATFGIGSSSLVCDRARGEPVVALAAIFQHSPLVILAREGSGIDNVHDLVGKRVMLETDAAELIGYLQSEAVRPEDVIRVPHEYDPTALIEGRVDAMSAYLTDEPYLLTKAGVPVNRFSPQAASIDFYSDVLFTSEATLRDREAEAQAFVTATLRGWRYAFDHTAEAIEITVTKYGSRHDRAHLAFEADQMRRLVAVDRVPIGHMTIGRWTHIASVYRQLGLISSIPPLDGFVYPAPRVPSRNWLAVIVGGLAIVISLILLVGLCDLLMHERLKPIRVALFGRRGSSE